MTDVERMTVLSRALREGIETYVDVEGMKKDIEDYIAAFIQGNMNAQQEATQDMANHFFAISERAVKYIPLTGTFYRYIVDALETTFNAGYDHVSGHVVELEYTDAICDYYTDAITLEDLFDRIEKIFPEEEAQERI